MGAIRLIAIADLRHRWRELLLLALLVAATTGAAMAATVASVRAESSIDRFQEWSRQSSAGFPAGEDPGPLIDALRALPDVEEVAVAATLSVFVVEDEGAPFAGTSFEINAPFPVATSTPTGTRGVDIDRPLTIAGRMPNPARPDEVLIMEWLADLEGWEIGDRVPIRTLTPQDMEAGFETGVPPGLNGPRLELEVVGIGRSGPDIAGEAGQGSTVAALGTLALATETLDEALWWPADIAVRTSTGAPEFDLLPRLGPAGDALREEGDTFLGVFVGGVTDARAAAVETANDNVRTMAVGLATFGAVAMAVGALIVGQAVVRHLAGTAAMRGTLAQLGQSRRATATAATLPVLVATIAGVSTGAVTAIVASKWLPTGMARRAEVDPGIWVRPDLLIPIGLITVVTTIAFCFVVAFRRPRERLLPSGTPSTIAMLRHIDPPVSVEAGARLALQRGTPTRALPTRSAFTGLAIAVVAATAGVTLVHNVHELETSPSRWGWNWSSAPDYFGDDPEGTLAAIAARPDVDGVAALVANGVSLNGNPMGGFAIEPIAGDVEFVVFDGRSPAAPGEVALGERTLRRLDVDLGDTVDLADFSGDASRTVTVVGVAVFPFEITETLDDGVALLPETLASTTDMNAADRTPVIRYTDGARPAEVESALTAEYDIGFSRWSRPLPPAPVRNLSVTNDVAIALAIFLSALGITAVIHAVVVTERRRRWDLAVLRALGFTGRQIRVAFLTQALVFGAVAAVVGVPSGVALAIVVWRAVTANVGAVVTPTVPWALTLAIVPLVLVTAALVSWWPGRSASRRDPTTSLRAE